MSDQRTIGEIVIDPKATDAEIRRMARSFPMYAVDHPNCPVDLWWELAPWHPLVAMRSPAFGVMTLENPSRWQDMWDRSFVSWVGMLWEELPYPQASALELDLVQHALDAYSHPYGWSYDNKNLFLRKRYMESRRNPSRVLSDDLHRHYREAYRHWQRILGTDYQHVPGNIMTRMLIFENMEICEFTRNLCTVMTSQGETQEAARQWIWDRLVAYLDGNVTPINREPLL